jgi:sugar phosphate isomerase/epimerase
MSTTKEETMNPELIATCWVSAGDAAPMRADEVSPVPLPERIAAVARTGWAGIGLVYADLVKARETIGYDGLSRLIREAGIGIVEVEFLNDWWATGAERSASDRIRADLFEAAKALGAPHLKVGAGMADDDVLPLPHLASAFADLAAEAEDAGLKLALEATPFSHLKTIQEAIEVVSHSASPSGGLMVDIWHTAKTGVPHDELWKIVPMDRVHAVEIDDGFHATPGTLFEDSTNNRAYCGEGEFDTPGFVRAALDAGWTGPWGVEIISAEHRGLPVLEGLKKARDTALACFPAAG